MKKKLKENKSLKNWHFGKYTDKDRQRAYLIIRYISQGKLAKHPLELPFSDYSKSNYVMTKLLDNSADIDKENDIEELKTRLKTLDVKDGIYTQKVGHVKKVFILPPNQYGNCKKLIVVDKNISEISYQNNGTKGSLKKWKETVGKQAEASSYCMFGIALAFAAAIYKDIISHEGVIFNFAGTSGLGKTTASKVAKSVTGQTTDLYNWNISMRALSEKLAANSDTLFIIDDWEKLNSRSSTSKRLSEVTHFATAGNSKDYSSTVKESLPDLKWSCPILTSGPYTIENQAKRDSYERTNGDRRRMIDIPIPSNGGKGIWDNLPEGKNSRILSENISKATQKNYGEPFGKWIEILLADKKTMLSEIKKKQKKYVKLYSNIEDTGFETTISQKFGVVYAAGIVGIKKEILPWDSKVFKKGIRKLHKLAINEIEKDASKLRRSFFSIKMAISDKDKFSTVQQKTSINFADKENTTGFIHKTVNGEQLFITIATLKEIVGGVSNYNLVITKLKEINALKIGSENKTCIQQTVLIGGKKTRSRFIQINLDKFNAEIKALKKEQKLHKKRKTHLFQ